MIVPQFWAEARVHQPRASGQRQITVRRFGWSDISQAEADALADQRAKEAFRKIVAGEKLNRREPKVPYNGALGVPIREEVLARHGDVVITRNAYGAHCLNTPDVLFADVDFGAEIRPRVVLAYGMLLLTAAVLAGVWFRLGKVTILLGFVSLFLAFPLAAFVKNLGVKLRGGMERIARKRIEAFVRTNPEWHLRLYRTPAGFRVLALHAVFDPNDPKVAACFAALGVDPIYAAMCRNQHCFRARVSPKPWRIGIASHLRPRPGVWPVKPERLEVRRSWIRTYEAAATGFAACRFVESLGTGTVHPRADAVRVLHDRLSQALSGREIA